MMRLLRAACLGLASVVVMGTVVVGDAWVATQFDNPVSPCVFIAIATLEVVTFAFYISDH